MHRLIGIVIVFALLGIGLRVADAQIVVTDPAITIKNIVTAALKSQIVDTLTEQARQIRRMARRLSVFTDLAKYARPRSDAVAKLSVSGPECCTPIPTWRR